MVYLAIRSRSAALLKCAASVGDSVKAFLEENDDSSTPPSDSDDSEPATDSDEGMLSEAYPDSDEDREKIEPVVHKPAKAETPCCEVKPAPLCARSICMRLAGVSMRSA